MSNCGLPGPCHIFLIIAVAAFTGVMSALFVPAFQSLVPDLIPRDRLAIANSINLMSSQTSTLVGQALGGVLWMALAALLAIGALSSIINVTVITAFQSTVSPDVRGRVMALVVALSTAAVPVGMALGGVLGDHGRSSLHLVFAGSGVTIAILAGSTSVVRGFDDAFERSHGEERSAALPRQVVAGTSQPLRGRTVYTRVMNPWNSAM